MISLSAVIILILWGLLLYRLFKTRSKYREIGFVGFAMIIAFLVARASLHIEVILYVEMWLLYFFVLYKLFKKKSIYAPIFLLCCAALNYRLPLFFGYEGRLFEAGLVFCISISIADYLFKRKEKKKYDRLIWKGVFIYYLLILASVLTRGNFDRVPTMIYVMIDQSFVFFITIQCLKDKKDLMTLLKGLTFAACLIGIIALVGYAVNDPWWGQHVYDNSKIMDARDPYLPYKTQVRLSGQYEGRVTSTASNANALGATMAMCFPIAAFLLYRSRGPREIALMAIALAIIVISFFLASSRSAFIAGIIGLLLLISGIIFHKRHKRWSGRKIVTLLIMFFVVLGISSSAYFSGQMYHRLASIHSAADILDAGDRAVRWHRELSNLDLFYFIIGRGVPGSEGYGGAHSNYLGIVYAGGLFALIGFLVVFLRAIKNALRMEDRFMGFCLFVSLSIFGIDGITQESCFHHGPAFVFWSIVAILAAYVFREKSQPVIGNNIGV